MQIYGTFSHLLHYKTQVWMPKIECHTQAASGCFHLKHIHFQLARHQQISEVKARIRFCRLRLLGLQHLHVCLHLSTLGSSQFIQRNSCKFVNILYSILDATAYQNTFVALSQLISTWLAQACAPMNCASCIWEEAATDLEKIAIQQGFLSQN